MYQRLFKPLIYNSIFRFSPIETALKLDFPIEISLVLNLWIFAKSTSYIDRNSCGPQGSSLRPFLISIYINKCLMFNRIPSFLLTNHSQFPWRPILNFLSFDSTQLVNEHAADFDKIKNLIVILIHVNNPRKFLSIVKSVKCIQIICIWS